MDRRIAKLMIATALVVVMGGHWAVVQSVAWVGMAVSYSHHSTIAIALKKTFDGRHPCELCLFVKASKQSQKKQDLQKLETKLDLWLVRTPVMIFPPAPVSMFASPIDPMLLRFESPPVPPPRSA
jgi:hypothetical protein